MKMNYEIKEDKLECAHHGKLDRYIIINGKPDCPHCLLQFLLINDIDTRESNFMHTNWEINEIKC